MRWLRAGWAAYQRARLWPGIATPELTARAAGTLLLIGSPLVAAIATLAPTSFDSVGVEYGNAAVGVTLGVCTLLWGRRLSFWQFQILTLIATVQVSVAVYEASTAFGAVSMATLYVFIACAGFFVPWPAAVVHVGLAVLCCLLTLAQTSAAPWWAGLIAAGTTAAIGSLIAFLSRLVVRGEIDPLTGLPNRQGFDRLLDMALNRSHPHGPQPALVLICIDECGAMRRQLGYRAADDLLQTVIARWREVLAPEDVLARLAEDEFAVLLPQASETEAVALSHRLRAAAGRDCAAGVTGWQPGESAATLLSRADIALRRAKRGGRNRTMLESSRLTPLAVELRDALDADAIDVRYQPVVRLADPETVIAVEALVRWVPDSRPSLTCADVIEAAENANLIAALDRYVLRRACLDARWMQAQVSDRPLLLAVNVSGLELTEAGYADRVREILEETGWPADQLVLEVTESVLDADTPAATSALHEVRRHGVRIAIDDFGSGYSSLSRLHTIPTDYLKLDAAFTASLGQPRSSAPLLRAVAALADALNLPVVVEGVETAEQAAALERMGFAMAQGFHFGAAQARHEVVAAVAARSTAPVAPAGPVRSRHA
ncbi:bifunctional diguanylate cyclase/phosphodiesterase [Mycobacterium sp. MYCO198283]|uniref:putative bifunctional diguanylate cyclase/phosphodiesterase n=1 Tax=Mycobacterium sp. MYCO198283 TaxID=2883505 RepID=UPI001E420737|nr:bifunctional diguanylate cyclase/phosphodiesterase [Mycobacterium sp. MYCO198283]MCG5433055.1 bifunctional diguanylate cyclase/phosphodiesterase [Mycobacterium sp. MYCO198283]